MRLQCLPRRVACHWLGNVHSQITHTHIHEYILSVPIEYLLKIYNALSIPYTYLIECHLRYLIKYLIEYPVHTIPSVSGIVYSSKILEEIWRSSL